MIFIICYVLGWLAGILMLAFNNGPHDGQAISRILLSAHLNVTVGLTGLLGAYGHLFMSDKIARKIGWQPGSMFQRELGYCCLGTGLMGIASFWFRDNFWLATIIFTSTFLLGAAQVHITEMKKRKNFNRGNSLPVIPDLLIPFTLILLWAFSN